MNLKIREIKNRKNRKNMGNLKNYKKKSKKLINKKEKHFYLIFIKKCQFDIINYFGKLLSDFRICICIYHGAILIG